MTRFAHRACLLACLLAAQPVLAEPPATVPEAIAEGYNPRQEDEPAGSLLGGAIAIGPGFLVHGLGHYYAGDTRTALTLLLAELTGIGLAVAGAIVQVRTNGAGSTGGVGNALVHAGTLLFLGSWAADIIGTFKGSESFEPSSRRVKTRMIGLAYRFTDNPLTPFKHHLVTRLTLDNGRFWIRPELDLEAGLELWQLSVDMGGRIFVGDNPFNRIGVGLNARRHAVRLFGYTATSAVGFVEFQVDLGQVVQGMRNFYLFNRTGYGLLGYQFGPTLGEAPGLGFDFDFTDTYLLFETGFAVNVGRKTNISTSIVQDPTRDLAAGSADGTQFQLGLLHRQSADLDIELSLTSGDGWGVWLGLGYGL